MKRALGVLVALLVIVSATNNVQAQEQGDFRLGFRTGFYFRANAYAIGMYGTYGIRDWLNIEPGINYICKQKSTVDVYCDFQVPLEIAAYWHVYPIFGVSVHDIYDKRRDVDGWGAGLNIGLGTTYNMNDRWSLSAQAKWMGRVPLEHISTVVIYVGVDYNF